MSSMEEAKGAECAQVEDSLTEKMGGTPPVEPDAAMLAVEKKLM